MSEQQFLWNSLDGGENVFIKEGGSDKIIHIKIMEGKHEFVDFMKKVNEQQSIIRRDEMSIKTMMSNMKKLEEENEQLKKRLSLYNEDEVDNYLRTHPMPTTTITTKRRVIPLNMRHGGY